MSKENIFANEDIAKKEFEYQHIEIERLEEPIFDIMCQLSDKILTGEYSSIIGDDASGRIPALILRGAINKINDKLNLAHIRTLFLAGSGRPGMISMDDYELKFGRVAERVGEIAQSKDKKILIVTDTVATGNSLMPLTEALSSENIPYDIASVAVISDRLEGLNSKLGTEKIYYGLKDKTPGVYANPKLSGVEKEPTELYSKPVTKDYPAGKEKMYLQGDVIFARRDVGHMAEKLAKKFIAKYLENNGLPVAQ